MGPTTKLPTLGHISFKNMKASFAEQARGLLDGGADLLIVETCQDLLQTKAALAAILEEFESSRRRVPVIAQVTIEAFGTMLMGTEIGAALTALEPFPIDVIGMNCATGPQQMADNVRYLCQNWSRAVSVIPNAGIPENVGGHAVFKETPESLAKELQHFARDLGVNIVGGCCGTTPAHLQAVVEAVKDLAPLKREVQPKSNELQRWRAVFCEGAEMAKGIRRGRVYRHDRRGGNGAHRRRKIQYCEARLRPSH